jgi:hypothetical protein
VADRENRSRQWYMLSFKSKQLREPTYEPY